MADRWADWQTSLSSTTNVTGTAFSFHNAKQAGWEVDWPTNLTAGDVIIETATDKLYAGTWRPLYTITYNGATVAAPKKEGQEFDGPFAFMRARLINQAGTHTSPVVVKCQAMEME